MVRLPAGGHTISARTKVPKTSIDTTNDAAANYAAAFTITDRQRRNTLSPTRQPPYQWRTIIPAANDPAANHAAAFTITDQQRMNTISSTRHPPCHRQTIIPAANHAAANHAAALNISNNAAANHATAHNPPAIDRRQRNTISPARQPPYQR